MHDNIAKRFVCLLFVILNLSFCLAASQTAALPFRSELNRGNDLYKKGEFSSAEQVYNKILESKPNNLKAKFNLGDSLYKQGKYKESQQVFESLTGEAVAKNLRQHSFYNLGNSLFMQEDYQGAIKAYEEALKIDPRDEDARFNLELAKKMLTMPKEQRQKEKEEQRKKQQQKKEQEQKKKNEQGKSQDKERQQSQIKPGQMSKEDALRILNALENEEKHQAQRLKAARGKTDVKDW